MSTLIEVCQTLRAEAEKSCDPLRYKLASTCFEQAGMELAASRCRDRASHYQQLPEISIDAVAQTQPAEPAQELVFA